MIRLLAAAALLCAGHAAAAPVSGWVKQGSSLLHYDSSATLSGELPLGRWEDFDVRGGTSKNGSFAWTWDARSLLLRFFGPSGRELWSAERTAATESGEPLALSGDGELLLLCRGSASGSTVEVRSFVGNTLWQAGPFPILHAMELTRNGRYALLRWTEPEKAASHTFLAVALRKRKDVASAELHLGRASIDESGAVRSGGKTLFSMEEAAKTP